MTAAMRGPMVVIGGGIVGSAIAFELQDRGIETVLIDRDTEPQGVSAFSFASLSAFDEPSRDVYLVKSLGLLGWHQWAKRLDADLGLTWEGEIRWAETREGADRLQMLLERASSRGYPARSISADELRQRHPESSPGEILGATYAPEDGQADPVRAIHVLRSAFEDRGGTLLFGRAGLVLDGETVKVRLAETVIDASKVVVATGAETGSLLERFGWEIPMDPSPGFLVVTHPTNHSITGTVYVTPAQGAPFFLRQLSDGRILMGERAQNQVAHDPTTEHAHELLALARKSFPQLARVELDHFTVEWRPMPRDGMPIIGPLPGAPDVFIAAAHSAVTIAPALADLIAQELINGGSKERLRPFRPTRFAKHRADAYVSIEEVFDSPPEVFLG